MNRPFPLSVTPAAHERLAAMLKELPASQGLRVGIEGGGCAGFRYQFNLEDPEADDFCQELDGVRVFIDPVSASYLDGSELDFTSTLFASQFVLRNPKVQGTCGCGQSVAL